MEDSWENWISSLEMGHINSLDQDKIVQHPPNFSFQSVHNYSSTMSYNNNNNSVFPTTSTMGSSSLSCDDASFDGKMLKSNSSNSSNISQDVAPPSSTFILSFENSTVEPRPNSSSPKHFGGEVTCSSLLSSERTTLSSGHNNVTKPKAKQGTKKYRSSSEIQDHIMAERKRRQELSERFIALSATIPGLKKTDKAYILREAIIYMKQLQERVKELENQNKRRTSDSRIFIKKSSQVFPKEEPMSASCKTNSYGGYRPTPPLPQVEARVLENEVLIGIHCQRQKDVVLKIMALLQNLHLSLASSSVLPFGTSTLKVTIIAQMGDKYCMTVNDLVKALRQDLLKSHDIRESYS